VKILIADDEKLVRYSLKSMLEEIDVSSRSIDVACNGEEMVAAVLRSSPDIAFVDIKMPRLDGLAAIKQARAISPRTHWIILTSHSSFDFAQRALQLGVEDYLLKPVSPDDLERVIAKAAREIRRDTVRLNDEFEGRISSLMHGTLSLDNEEVEFVSAAHYLGAVLIFDSVLEEKLLAERQRAACREIRARVATAVEKTTRIALCTLPVGQIVLIGAWLPGADEALARELVRGFFRRVHALLNSTGTTDGRVTQLLSDECSEFPSLLERLLRTNERSALRVCLGIGRQIEQRELEAAAANSRWDELCASLAGLVQAYRRKGRLDFFTFLERAGKALQVLGERDREEVRQNVSRFLHASLAMRADTGMGESLWQDTLRSLGETLHGEEREGGELVEQVIEFVRANYARDIGIGRIAFDLGVTPNYLSSLFHREIGVTFVKYLTRLRLEKGRELLSARRFRVQDVAREVGYSSVRHFSRLFQKQFGVYPSEVPKQEKNAPQA
jgi:two-component system response regulator YesN